MAGFGKGHQLHLIDGSGFVFRAFHQAEYSLRSEHRYRSDGLPVGAVHFYCNMLMKFIEDRGGPFAPTHAAVVFDTAEPTFRSEIYPDYKAHRPPPPPDLVPQFKLVRDATRAFNIPYLELDGYEADDIIATLAERAQSAGAVTTIHSSDKDLMQLISDTVQMYDPRKSVRMGFDHVQEKFGVMPDRVVDVQALAGDPTDNVPGAPGIGPKIAALLINTYGDLETLLERAPEVKQPKRRQTLIEKAGQIRVSKALVKLRKDVPIQGDFESLAVKEPNPERLINFLRSMEFRTITRRVAAKYGVSFEEIDTRIEGSPEAESFDPAGYETVRDGEALQHWIKAIVEQGFFAFDTETTGLDEMQSRLVGVSLALDAGKACYIPLNHLLPGGGGERVPGQLDLESALSQLRPVLEDESILKIGHNIKFDIKILANYDVVVKGIADTMLMSYVLHAGSHRHGMDELSAKYLDHRPIPIKELIGTGKKAITFDRVDIEKAAPYASEDADITFRLWKQFLPQLPRSRVNTVYETLERPLVPVLVEMERTGIKVDRERLVLMSGEFENQIARLESRIFEVAGVPFKIGSPKQLGEILFDRLGLPGGKKGKSGAYTTGAAILANLASEEEHELPSLVLDWRQLTKLKSTYTDALLAHINPSTGRVHTSYSIAGANTGRLASNDPNLQNIPVRTEEGRRIREAFVPRDGSVLLSLDYSQIELRILAHVAGIEALQRAFTDGVDIHALTASEIFDVPVSDMDPMIRRRTKAINFGVIYGISAFGLARNLRIPRSEAKTFIDAYFEKFPGIRDYMKETVAYAKKLEYVKTMFGRRIHTPRINAKGPQAGLARRAAINAPIQGAAADLIRRAMVRIPDAIGHLPASMLLQVHDELIFEVEESAAEEAAEIIGRVMTTASHPVVEFFAPLVVDSGTGRNWAEAH